MEDTAPDALPVETEGVAAAPGPAPGAAAAPAPAAMFQTFVPSPTRKKSVTVQASFIYEVLELFKRTGQRYCGAPAEVGAAG